MGARGLGHVAEAGARIVLSVLILTILVLGVTGTRSLADEPSGDTLRIASFNLHFIRPEGRLFERWLRRRDAVIAAIRELDADIVALQEVETFAGKAFNDGNLQLDWLREQLPDYAVAAVGDVRSYPSTQPVLYRPGKLAFVDQGYHFFSETPDVVYSRTYNGGYDTFASWVRFRLAGGDKSLVVFNSHFHHTSGFSRLKSAELTRERARRFLARGEPVLIVGDFNSLRWTKTAAVLRSIPARFARIGGPTFHFGHGLGVFPAIDHFVYTEGLELVGRPSALRKRFGGIWPGDHHPIVGDFALR